MGLWGGLHMGFFSSPGEKNPPLSNPYAAITIKFSGKRMGIFDDKGGRSFEGSGRAIKSSSNDDFQGLRYFFGKES